MKKHGLVLALFAILVLVYFRGTLLAPSDALITRHAGTDLYIYSLHSVDFLNWLKHGFVPVGDYWVPHGGGFPATPLDQLPVPAYSLLLVLYAATNNVQMAFRIFDPLIYFLALVATYWYGTVLFKKTSTEVGAVVLAVAYSFSMYGLEQLEHPDLLSAIVLVPLALGFLEKTFQDSRAKYIVLTSVCTSLVYITHLYAFYFLLMYLVLRVAYELLQRRSVALTATLVAVGALFLLTVLPFFLTQLGILPSQTVRNEDLLGLYNYAQPPGLYFVRDVPDLFTSDNSTMYLGITVTLLALLPIILRKTNRYYVFCLVVATFFLLYAVGRYGPVNLAALIQRYAPLAYFIRVPGRSLVIGYLAFGACAAAGAAVLVEGLSTRSRYLAATLVVAAVFCDLTIGYEPPAVPMPIVDNGAYEFIAAQQGDFRTIEIPSISTQIAMADIYTGHEVLSWLRWSYNYYEPLYAPANLSPGYLTGNTTAEQAATYNVKYVIVNTQQLYYDELKLYIAGVADQSGLHSIDQTKALRVRLESSPDYKLVYDKDDYAVFENLAYVGFVFSNTPTEVGVVYRIVNPNTITLDVVGPADITISQSYDEGWTTNVGTLTEKDSVQLLSVPAGAHHVTLHYDRYGKSLLWFLIYIPLSVLITWMLWHDRVHKTP